MLLYIQRGRNENRYAVLTFSPDVDTFTAFNFDGAPAPLAKNRQLKK